VLTAVPLACYVDQSASRCMWRWSIGSGPSARVDRVKPQRRARRVEARSWMRLTVSGTGWGVLAFDHVGQRLLVHLTEPRLWCQGL